VSADPGPTYALHHARVLEQDGGFSGETDVVVEDGLVTGVGPGLQAPEGAPAYDLRGLWLMPGVIDCHEHVANSTMDEHELLHTPASYSTLEASVNLRKTLEAGVTLVRDAGGADAGMRRAIDDGLIPGPRLQLSIRALSQTGGHADMHSERLGLEDNPLFNDILGTVDGLDAMRVTVRRLVRAGADCIKLCTTGGVLSPHDTPYDLGFTAEEIATAVDEAARSGKPVMSHAIAGGGIDLAVANGVRSIEHGTLLTEDQAEAMAAAGCWLVPTLSIIKELIDATLGPVSGAPGEKPVGASWAYEKVLGLRDSFGDCVRIARTAGVRIAVGCDWLDRRQHGRNLEELSLLHEAGVPAEEVLLAATAGGAELCGVAARYGRIAPGFVFDAVVLGRDPSDMAVFRDRTTVREVFKAGVACRSGGDLLAERG
jgi:imidazolonepropionase-like amidohydrolase